MSCNRFSARISRDEPVPIAVSDGSTTTSAYDALNRLTARGATTYTYNGDGALVYDGATRYTQDLAASLSQMLQTTQGVTTHHARPALGAPGQLEAHPHASLAEHTAW